MSNWGIKSLRYLPNVSSEQGTELNTQAMGDSKSMLLTREWYHLINKCGKCAHFQQKMAENLFIYHLSIIISLSKTLISVVVQIITFINMRAACGKSDYLKNHPSLPHFLGSVERKGEQNPLTWLLNLGLPMWFDLINGH